MTDDLVSAKENYERYDHHFNKNEQNFLTHLEHCNKFRIVNSQFNDLEDVSK